MNKLIKWFVIAVSIGFILVNVVAYNHAYRFTHFSDGEREKTATTDIASFSDKLGLLFKGVENPRPDNKRLPEEDYETIYLESRETLEVWLTTVEQSKGVILLFHGYTGEKSDLLEVASKFRKLGYHTMLIDFPGSGGSGGMRTTIGYYEAEDVKAAFLYAQNHYCDLPIILYGFSLGGVSIMRAISELDIHPSGAIVESPFGTMLNSVRNRFEMLNIPAFPFAHLLTFWGGMQHGFWAFSHNPIDYAKQIDVPTLLTFGLVDNKVDAWEIERIYANIAGNKEVRFFEGVGHELASERYPSRWLQTVDHFLHEI